MLQHKQTKEVNLWQLSCSDKDRFLKPPSDKQIDDMAKSLKADGQIMPIAVHVQTHNSYRIIAGVTRFRAATKLGLQKIRVSIFAGSDIDFKLLELRENIDRRDLTGMQRKEMRAEMKRLQAEQARRLAAVEPAKGGRGKKGGRREEARREGVPTTTAHDRVQKLFGKAESRTVSEIGPARPKGPVLHVVPDHEQDAPTHVSRPAKLALYKFSMEMTQELREAVAKQGQRDHFPNFTEACREALRRYAYQCKSVNDDMPAIA